MYDNNFSMCLFDEDGTKKILFFCTDNVYSLEMIELNLDYFYGD